MELLVDPALLKSPMEPLGAPLSPALKIAVRVWEPDPSEVAVNVKGLDDWLAYPSPLKSAAAAAYGFSPTATALPGA